ncbi:MAG: ECF transporter S component [Erysipelotrichaceae bacterium]|nr:ECF transporter S component [Erysipelotrichaceae bacterium]
MRNRLSVRNIATIAILGVLGAILMLFDFPIAIAPNFYKLDLSDLPCLIGAFALGPVPAFFIQVIKIIVKMLLKPTSTAFVGELAAFVISTTYCVSAALVYQKNRTKKGAILAMLVGSLCMAIIGTFANYAFIIPFYVNWFHLPLETIIGMGNAIFPIIHDKFSFVLCCVLPFNLIKALIVDIVTFVIYKHVSPLLKQ